MKRLIATYLLLHFTLGALIPLSDFSQLAKVTELHDHYVKHNAAPEHEGEQISFLEFLYMHYVSNETHEHSDEDHKDLPLQDSIHSQTLFLVKFGMGLQAYVTEMLEQGTDYKDAYSDDFPFSLFHPPRV